MAFPRQPYGWFKKEISATVAPPNAENIVTSSDGELLRCINYIASALAVSMITDLCPLWNFKKVHRSISFMQLFSFVSHRQI